MGVQRDKLAQVFDAAAELSTPAERAAFLDAACGPEQELRAEVEELLKHDDAAGSFLGRTAYPSSAVTVDVSSISEGPGTVIGPYKLLEQIGEGGFGVVFMAEQTQPVRRKVALKVLKPGMDTRQVIARFEAERQALAMMDHVNIARVLEAGATESGRPYFVMELVHGVPITRYCDDNHLTPRERLELFVPVCQAIQHAHQKGIIHRDIKPSNVMITLYDGKPVPKVIDFGVAKATEQRLTDRTLFTQYGTVVGTFEYMSPEQAEMSALGVDTRSDIYSLGVLLYELLTGSTPLTRGRVKESAYAEILRMIKEDEPPKPSTRLSDSGKGLASISAQRRMEPAKLTKLMRGELDWIVMKALEKDRNRRYETANDLALDVQRYLTNEPVLACPPSTIYRMQKFVRRHRTAIGLAGAFVVLVVVAGAVSAWQAVRATLAERQALADRDQAQREKDRAETSYKLARGALDEVVKLEDDARFQRGSLEDVRRTLLQAEAAFYQKFVQQKGDDPQFQSERAGAFLRLADLTSSLANKEEAIQHAQQALVIAQDLAGHHPDVPGYDAELARSHQTLGRLYQDTGRHKEAEDSYANAIAITERLAREHPTIAQYQSQLVRQHFYRCGLYGALGRSKDAEDSGRKAVSISGQLVSKFPTVAQYQADLARSHLGLEDILRNSGQHKEAETSVKHAIAIMERLAGEHPEVIAYQDSLARSQHELGIVYMDTRRYNEAEESYRKAIGIRERMVREHPSVGSYQDELAFNYSNLGIACIDTGRYSQAEDWLQKALTVRERLASDHPTVTEYHAELANTYIVLAGGYLRSDRTEKGEAVLKRISKYSLNQGGLYNLACAYALIAAAHGKNLDQQGHAAERQQRAGEYASRAMDILRQAVAKGFGNTRLMQTDHDLDYLRSRDDFKMLLAEVEQKAKSSERLVQ
jgi:serine/threonine protein kinase/tetratricopeptide (TPR) repeat protein